MPWPWYKGLGGVGKSSVVREYGWRNRDRVFRCFGGSIKTEDGIIDGLLHLGTMFMQGLEQTRGSTCCSAARDQLSARRLR